MINKKVTLTHYHIIKKVKFGEDKASKNMFDPLDPVKIDYIS